MTLRRSAVILVLGLSLLGVAALQATAVAQPSRQGGLFRVNISDTDVDYLDPALAYDVFSWQILAATCAKLLNYPDRSGSAGARLRPEVASSMPRVSANGRTYTFTLRGTYRFNTGETVTPESFVRAFERALSPRMQSPAASFSSDIAGAAAFSSGKAKRIGGIQVSGNQLTIRLSKPAPDFLARLAMPFFCAVPSNLPLNPQGERTPPMAGPYYIAQKVPNRVITLRRNPNYRGPRPQRVDEFQFIVNANLNTSYLQVQKGQVDYDAAGLPPTAHAQLTRKYGINRGRYFVHPGMSIIYVALNTSRPLFRDAAMRRAVNFALDRRALLRLAGLNAGSPTDQILPPNMPGFENGNVYPFTPNVARAQQLTGGRTGKAVLYAGNDTISKNQSVIIQANLRRIGIEVEVRSMPFATQIAKTGKRGEPFDMNLIGWFADYPDPYDFINVLLDGRRLQDANNVNTAYFNDPAYNRKMAEASLLSGPRRYRTYGALDLDITRNAAPLATLYNTNTREFVSARTGCYSFHPVWGSLNLAAVCLK